MTHAAESTHWYTRAGEPAYTVKAKDGTDRPTNLRDARKLNLVPSVTTIIRCATAPGLDLWKQKQVLLAALTLPRHAMEADEVFMYRVMADSKEQARKAAEKGTAIHAAIQGHYEGIPPDEHYWPHVQGTAKAIMEHFGGTVWTAERSFSHALGFGGKIDLHDDKAVVDFKTKEFGPDDKLATWDEHAMQIGAYQAGLDMLGTRGAICYVSTTVPGLARVMEIDAVELLRGWDMFQGLMRYWCGKNKYFSALAKGAT